MESKNLESMMNSLRTLIFYPSMFSPFLHFDLSRNSNYTTSYFRQYFYFTYLS